MAKKDLKLVDDSPKRLEIREAIELETYPIVKESLKNRVELLKAQLEIKRLTFKMAQVETSQEMLDQIKLLEKYKKNYNQLMAGLREKYGLAQIAYNPESFELMGEQENGE